MALAVGRTSARRQLVAIVAVATAGAIVMAGAAAAPPGASEVEIVLSAEANHLWAYDATTGEAQLVNGAVNPTRDPGASPPPGSEPRDINGQLCISPDGKHLIAGEDSVLPATEGGDGGDSHDPRIAGWGYFRIQGNHVGQVRIRQEGKLAPEAGSGPGYNGDPDNYGCGFLDGDRLFTTAIGDPLFGAPANGQLFLWFGPFDAGYHEVAADGVRFFVGEVDHCEIDGALATAGGIAIDDNGDVYVAANRPDDAGNPGAVWRYSGTWPTSAAECTPEFLEANITKTLVVPPAPVPNPVSLTPSAVVISPDDTLYVSSVFTGTVSEYTKDGVFVRDVWPQSPVAPRSGPFGDTPFGLAFTSDGALWIADIGIVGADAAAGEGSVRRVPFDGGSPQAPGETVAEGLDFPDGLGVYKPIP